MKMSKKIAAIACAALMATQMAAFNASAANLYYYGGVYFTSATDASIAAGPNSYSVVDGSSIPANTVSRWYSPSTGRFYLTQDLAAKAGEPTVNAAYVTTGTNVSVPYYNGNYYNGYYYGYNYITGYYSSVTGKTYSSYSDALAASGNDANKVSTIYNNNYYDATHVYSSIATSYYSYVTGHYYNTYSAALSASGGNDNYVFAVYGNGATGGGTYYSGATIYRYLYKGVYYPTLEAAVAAGGTVGVDITYTAAGSIGDTKNYYYYNGTYYGSLQAAMNAGGKELGKDITYVPYNYYSTTYTAPVVTTTPTVYNTVYKYYDPYFTYRNYAAQNNSNSSSSSTSSSKVEEGVPYIYGNKSKNGWSTLVNIINKASKGASYTVDMNGSSVVDASVMKALKGKDVTMNFVLDNGVKWSINGKKITSAKEVVIYTEYNIDYIPSDLVKKATKNAISKAQVGVSATFDKLGTKANVTVGFDSKRAGCTATVYRYDPESKTLKGVGKAKVQSNGKCTITVDQGGPYLFVLK